MANFAKIRLILELHFLTSGTSQNEIARSRHIDSFR